MTDAEVEEVFARVRSRLPEEIDDHHGAVTGGIRNQIRRGWSEDDIVAWNRCLAEVSPEMDEGTALDLMDRIERRYGEGVTR